MKVVKPDTSQLANHAVLEGKNSYCGLSRWFEVRSQDRCSWSADPVNRTGSIQHLTWFTSSTKALWF